MTLIGDEKEDIIKLPNGMVIHIDYGDPKLNTYGIENRFSAENRRVRLFDKNNKLISELVESNPHKTNIKGEVFDTNYEGDVVF